MISVFAWSPKGAMSGLFQKIFLLGLLSTWLGTSDVRGQSLEMQLASLSSDYSKLAIPIVKKLESYRDQESLALAKLKSELQKLRGNANAQGNPLGAADLLQQIDALESWLQKGGELGKCDFLLPLIFDYALSLAKARDGVEKPLNTLLTKLKKEGRVQESQALENALCQLGGLLNGANVFKVGKRFGGSRCAAGEINNIRLKLTVEKVLDNTMAGQIERDTGIAAHPVHGMSGSFKGMTVVIDTLASRIPGNKQDGNWRYVGYVFGRTIVGQYSGFGLKGKPGHGFFRLDQL